MCWIFRQDDEREGRCMFVSVFAFVKLDDVTAGCYSSFMFLLFIFINKRLFCFHSLCIQMILPLYSVTDANRLRTAANT